MEVMSKTTLLLISIVSICESHTPIPAAPTFEMNDDTVREIEDFFKNNPDIYGKVKAMERLAESKNPNNTELKILQDRLMDDMQPRIIDSCDEVFFNKHKELHDRVFLYKNATKFFNVSALQMQNKELMESATLLTLYRDELTKLVRRCIRKGVTTLKNGERFELHKRLNQSLVKPGKEMQDAIKNHAEFEMAIDVKQSFCHNIIDRWLEDHIVDMERAVIIDQKFGFIPIQEELRKKMIHQCFIFVTIQKDYVRTCVNTASIFGSN